jgi:F-type H+-transporting ATPase subunit delta
MASSLTRPFVQVFSELIPEESVFLEAVDQLESILQAVASDGDLWNLLVSPAIPRSVREGVIRRTLGSLEINEIAVNTVVMMIRKNVIGEFKKFVAELRVMADQRCGIARGTVSTAVDISSSDQETIRKMVAESLGKVAALQFVTDPDLLGGVRLRMREMELDASYRKQLQDAKSKLKKKRA